MRKFQFDDCFFFFNFFLNSVVLLIFHCGILVLLARGNVGSVEDKILNSETGKKIRIRFKLLVV